MFERPPLSSSGAVSTLVSDLAVKVFGLEKSLRFGDSRFRGFAFFAFGALFHPCNRTVEGAQVGRSSLVIQSSSYKSVLGGVRDGFVAQAACIPCIATYIKLVKNHATATTGNPDPNAGMKILLGNATEWFTTAGERNGRGRDCIIRKTTFKHFQYDFNRCRFKTL